MESENDDQLRVQKVPKEGNNINRTLESRCFEEIDTKKLGSKIEIDLTEEVANERAFFEKQAVITRFIGPKMSRKTIHDWADNNWGKRIVVKFLPKGFFIVVFTKESKRNHILEKENWYLGNHPLYIQPWTPNFNPTPLVVYEELVWVRLFNLPIEYWSDSSQEKIGRTLGTLLEIDEEIIENDLYTYKRLKIVVVKTIPQSITILALDGEWN
ncbi:hypothetical protein SUGI_1138080 [Cryptomeria japonica]|nr:hypothetical protein SUGI_1138080 [Cryptomeria japonica]